MPRPESIAAVGVAAVVAAYGTWLLLRSEAAAALARERYHRSHWLIQNWPFHSMVLRPWFPTYLRFGGAFCWVFALLVVAAVVFSR
jgi:hypothetical protein